MSNTVEQFLVINKLNHGLKLTGLTVGAITATFSLFVIMSKLVEDKSSYQSVIDSPIPVNITSVREDSDANNIVKTLPEPPEIKAMPKPAIEPQSTNSDGALLIAGGGFEMHGPSINTGYVATGNKNFGVMPIVRVPPNYPQKAAIDGIEGWVNLSFTVNKLGKVVNVKVVDAEPKRIFNSEAKKALRKWKYKPKMVNGEVVVQEDQYVMLEFKMDNR